MTDRPWLWRLTIAATLAMLPALPVAGQDVGPDGAWALPRTPDGQPDLQGVWTNATITPFERGSSIPYTSVVPESPAEKAFFTEEESARFEAQTLVDRPILLGAYNVVDGRRESIPVDAADLAGGRSCGRTRSREGVGRVGTGPQPRA